MKKIKLSSKNDVRIGNFVFHQEADYIKVYDINNMVSHRISTLIPKGQLLSMALKDRVKNEQWLMNYVAVTFNVLSCIPDNDFFADINKAAEACLSRHKNLYGIKDEVDPEEDAKVLESEKETAEVLEKMKEEGEV